MRLVHVTLALALVGCGGAVAQRPQVKLPEPPPETQERLDTDAIVAAVVKVRGLAPKTPIVFTTVDDEAFAVSFRAEIDRRRRVRGVTAASVSGAVDPSYYLAYYDTGKHEVLLRKKTPEWAKLQDGRELVAHEVEHAIQDQHFDLDKLLAEPEADVERAHLALIEGDAQAVAAGAAAVLDGLPPKRAVVRATIISEGIGVDTYVAGGLIDPRVASLKPVEREEMIFPYRHGAGFVGALVRAGGFALVDKAFARPPASSAEIIHPEAYLAGRVRQEVQPIADPVGYTAVGPKGAVGELALRNVLTSFGIPPERVHPIAAGWRGDSFVTFKGPTPRAAYAWTLAMADEPQASVLALTLAAHGRAQQRGNIVAYAEGFPDAVAKDVVAALLAAPVKPPPPPVPPFGAITIPPPPPRIEERLEIRATYAGPLVVNPNLGLRLALPSGFEGKAIDQKPGLVGLFITQGGAIALSVDTSRPTPLVVRAMAGGVLSGLKAQGTPSRKEDVRTHTSLGDVGEMRVGFDATGARLRFLVLPICKHEASLMVTFFLRGAAAGVDAEFDRWLQTIDAASIDSSPICSEVTAERTTDLP